MASHESSRPLGSLFTDVVSEVTHLFQTEMRLVRAEMNEKVSRVANSGALIGAGAIVMIPAVFILLLAIVRWLAVAGVPEQWGLTIVGAVIAIVGAALLMKGINNLKGPALVPDRTIRQVRADVSLAKEHV
jgi:mannose/fructose/N-acetylgalactosamine-specific phosphotransferase system component IIC